MAGRHGRRFSCSCLVARLRTTSLIYDCAHEEPAGLLLCKSCARKVRQCASLSVIG
jgi:hypothetical protein